MNVGQYRALLSSLETKRAEVLQVHDQYAFGHAKEVLARAMTDLDAEIEELLNIELMPVPVVVSISSTISTLDMLVGENEQLDITATYTDGSTRNVSAGFRTIVSYKDADGGYDNKGFITNVDASGYTLPAGAKITVVKTATGWNTYSQERLGLSLVEVGENTFEFVDINGDPIGLEFTTNGNEETGDNWIIDVEVKSTGTSYDSSDESVVSVNLDGTVYALGEGSAEITITNNNSKIVIPVTVTVA